MSGVCWDMCIHHVICAGSGIPEDDQAGGPIRRRTAQATQPLDLCFIRYEAFIEIMNSHPTLKDRILSFSRCPDRCHGLYYLCLFVCLCPSVYVSICLSLSLSLSLSLFLCVCVCVCVCASLPLVRSLSCLSAHPHATLVVPPEMLLIWPVCLVMAMTMMFMTLRSKRQKHEKDKIKEMQLKDGRDSARKSMQSVPSHSWIHTPSVNSLSPMAATDSSTPLIAQQQYQVQSQTSAAALAEVRQSDPSHL
eukprot:COSAG05_NODE_440_length_9809_cov_10.743769_11_plen_249_part_00